MVCQNQLTADCTSVLPTPSSMTSHWQLEIGRGEKSSNATHQRFYFLQSQAVNIDQHYTAQGLRFRDNRKLWGLEREYVSFKGDSEIEPQKKYRHARMQVQDG